MIFQKGMGETQRKEVAFHDGNTASSPGDKLTNHVGTVSYAKSVVSLL